MMSKILWTIYFFVQFLQKADGAMSKPECGYKQCPQPKEGALNVHLIAHSHMDAGWVKTFDEYYYGTRTSVSTASVQLIYHSVLSELLHDPRRKFTFSETAYFWRWWKEQRSNTRATFRQLVQAGRVEFAGGGWVQNDEATVGYEAVIDLYTWGLRKINDTIGPCGKPRAAWQIDSYGHTREQSSLLAQMGFDGLFLGRVEWSERENMIDDDRLEFMWRGSDVLGKMSDIMTHTLFNLYNPPDGFCFDFLCNDEPVMDDPESRVYNADKRVNDFISQVERQAKYYDHDNIVVLMGGDFTYQSAAGWFANMDKLINHVNAHPANLSDVNIFYSTPSCYLKAIYLYGKRDKALHTEKNDHLPYGSDAGTYWTGYYTSRPTLKHFARKAREFLQVMKQLTVIARTGDSYELHLLRNAVSLVFHHDAITGTSQQHVSNDFIRLIREAVDSCSKKLSGILSSLTPTWGGSRRSKSHQQFVVCHQLNISQCRFTETQDTMLLAVYNPSSVKTYHYVRLPAVALSYGIKDSNDEEVQHQLVPLPSAVVNLPGRKSSAIQEIYFEAENIPPLGYSAFYVTVVHDILRENEFAKSPKEDPNSQPFITNEYLKVTVNKETGLLESIQHVDGIRLQISQNFYFYSQSQATSLHSGAYAFRPSKTEPEPVAESAQFHTVAGPLVKEIRQRFSDWASQVIRLYRGEQFVEFEWLIGPVPFGSDLGKEVVSRFKTNISNNGDFFTDSNGRQMMKRSCWNHSSNGHSAKKSLPSCYYPVTSRVCLHAHNGSAAVCVLPDRTQGGTSYNEGEIELMVHRRLLTDDGFGLEETLNEEQFGVGLVARGRHRILLGDQRQKQDDMSFSEQAAAAARRWRHEPWLFLTSADKVNRRKWGSMRNKKYSALQPVGLPRHIHILTLEPWKAGAVLLRLENTREGHTDREGADESDASISVDLRRLFAHLRIARVRETTLAANQWLDEARQMDWSTRYMYSGGNDGMLPEDAEYGNEFRPNRREKHQDPSSSEEANFSRQRKNKRRGNRQRKPTKKLLVNGDHYSRRKRYINETLDIFDNVINKTIPSDRNVVKQPAYPDIQEIIKEKAETNEKEKLRTKKAAKLKAKKESKRVAKKKGSSEEAEEKVESETKKRRVKNLKKKELEIADDNDEEDVTKSIYEMYYKPQPFPDHPTPHEHGTGGTKPRRKMKGKGRKKTDSIKQDIEDDSSRDHEYEKRYLVRRGRYRDQVESSKTRSKADARSPRSRRTDSEEGGVGGEAGSGEETRGAGERLKRSSPKEESQPENSEESKPEEYSVTLRPTQIRTFVVWFENARKTFTL